MAKAGNDNSQEPRRGGGADDGAYLKLVGERVRMQRVRLGMSRKALSQSSGVSERYLAELERGTGNASLLVLRSISRALGVKSSELASEDGDPPVDMSIAVKQLEQLDPSEIIEARQMLANRFGRTNVSPDGLIALVGLRGSGKTTIGKAAARQMGIPFVELDREIETASGMGLSELFAVHGEAAFRRVERECLDRVIKTHPRAIITTGGGLVSAHDTYDLLLSSCYVVWLKTAAKTLYDRAGKMIELRPNGHSLQAMKELGAALEDREPLYARADSQLETSNKTGEQSAKELLQIIAMRDRNIDVRNGLGETRVAVNGKSASHPIGSTHEKNSD